MEISNNSCGILLSDDLNITEERSQYLIEHVASGLMERWVKSRGKVRIGEIYKDVCNMDDLCTNEKIFLSVMIGDLALRTYLNRCAIDRPEVFAELLGLELAGDENAARQ